MTLVLAVTGPKTIWLLTDRRLSRPRQSPQDDARKVMSLETSDGVALLGYAGLGATGSGTEPSDWMSAVLRTRNFPLELALAALAEAMEKQFPCHMVQMPGAGGPIHNIIVPAFLEGEPRLYTIDLEFAPDRKSHTFRCARQLVGATTKPPRIGLAGSGGIYLLQQKDKKWIRRLLRVVNANDRGQLSPDAVADHLAGLNYEVFRRLSDKPVPLDVRDTVGPRCVVAWRHKTRGGGNEFYTGTTRDANSPCLPTLAGAFDVEALVALPHVAQMFERSKARLAGQPVEEPTEDEINAELSRLPDKPDENLR